MQHCDQQVLHPIQLQLPCLHNRQKDQIHQLLQQDLGGLELSEDAPLFIQVLIQRLLITQFLNQVQVISGPTYIQQLHHVFVVNSDHVHYFII